MKAWLNESDLPSEGQNWCWECGVHLYYPGSLRNERVPGETEDAPDAWRTQFVVTCPVCSPEEYTWVRNRA